MTWQKRPAGVIATLYPYVGHRRLVIDHPLVEALRFNTSTPLAGSPVRELRELKRACGDKPLWIDLKGRQLRITEFAYLPYAYVRISRKIKVKLPARVYFKKSGWCRVVRIVGGDKLILDQRPETVVGQGQPLNIPDPSLRIQGFLTPDDVRFVKAAKRVGLHDYMLSFVESPADINELLKLDPRARVIAKIESPRGLRFVARQYRGHLSRRVGLMAARDDLWIELGENRLGFLNGLQAISRADPGAVVASRLLTSLETSDRVSCQDLTDLELMLQYGYRSLLLSDGICFRRQPFLDAMAVLDQLIAPRSGGDR